MMKKYLLAVLTLLACWSYGQAPGTKTVAVSMDTNGVVVSSVNRIGIGVLPATQPLHVVGNARITGFVTNVTRYYTGPGVVYFDSYTNLYIGATNLQSTLRGTGNIIIGANDSGGKAGSALTNGNYNIILGAGAAPKVYEAFGLVAIGKGAGANMTRSSAYPLGINTLLGADAGAALTTQGYNTLLGNRAGYAAIASNLTLVGESAGLGITSGINNVGVGDFCFNGLTTGSGNSSLGHRTVFGSTAAHCLALGEGVSVDGTSNTVIGGVEVWFGRAMTNPTSSIGVTLHAEGGSGTDVSGGNFIIAAGRGTGTGTPGNLKMQIATNLASGSTAQPLIDRITLDSTGTRIDGYTVIHGNALINGNLSVTNLASLYSASVTNLDVYSATIKTAGIVTASITNLNAFSATMTSAGIVTASVTNLTASNAVITALLVPSTLSSTGRTLTASSGLSLNWEDRKLVGVAPGDATTLNWSNMTLNVPNAGGNEVAGNWDSRILYSRLSDAGFIPGDRKVLDWQNEQLYRWDNGSNDNSLVLDWKNRYLYGDWTVSSNLNVLGTLTVDTLIARMVTNTTLNVTNLVLMGTANAGGFSISNLNSLVGNGSGVVSNFSRVYGPLWGDGSNITGLSAWTNGLATITYVDGATNQVLITATNLAIGDIVARNYVTATVTNGLAPISYVNGATNQVLITATNLAIGDIVARNYVTATVTNGLAAITYVDGATNQVLITSTNLAIGDIVGRNYIPYSVTNGGTIGYVMTLTNAGNGFTWTQAGVGSGNAFTNLNQSWSATNTYESTSQIVASNAAGVFLPIGTRIGSLYIGDTFVSNVNTGAVLDVQ